MLPVVFYHAQWAPFTGGYVGVDVFFVISGFLIASLLADSVDAGRYSLLDFYERRARRILPALVVVATASALLGYFLLLPDEYRAFGKSLVGLATFSSNVVFWLEAGYFDSSGSLKPLLHTWSLAVEEQFYLLFPPLLWLAIKLLRDRAWTAMLVTTVAGFGLSAWGLQAAPSATFYLAPFRAWELLIGATLALLPHVKQQGRWTATVEGLLGLALIGWCVFSFTETTSFPGWNALFPCLGAALIIHSGTVESSVVRKLLAWRPLVAVGLISYSLYLWHWVALSFGRYYAIRPLTFGETAALLAASTVLSLLTWQFVENPIRRRKILPRRSLLMGAAAASIAVLLIAGSLLVLLNGAPLRIPEQARALAETANDRFKPVSSECSTVTGQDTAGGRVEASLCQIGASDPAPTFLVWGDSHANALAPALSRVAHQQGRSGLLASYGGCPPASGVRRFDQPTSHACSEHNGLILDTIAAQRIKAVVLIARWAMYVEGRRYSVESGQDVRLTNSPDPTGNFEVMRAGLQATLERLAAMGVRVYIVGSVPEIGLDVPTALARAVLFNRHIDVDPTMEQFRVRQSRSHEMLSALAAAYGATLVLPDMALCGPSRCHATLHGAALYSDDDHLSRLGADQLVPEFEAMRL